MPTINSPQKTSFFARSVALITRIPNLIHVLKAQEQLNKFRALDEDSLKDMGLTPEHAAEATRKDFMPKRRT